MQAQHALPACCIDPWQRLTWSADNIDDGVCNKLPLTSPSKPASILSCRKKKAVHKVSTTDDKRLQATLKRLGVNTIPGIEEVNLFQDNDVIHFTNPKGGGPFRSSERLAAQHQFCSSTAANCTYLQRIHAVA